MAITGIDTIEGKQIIAAGAVSAKSAEMAYNDENGNPITGYQVAGDYYSASNPSGFLVADDITGKLDASIYATDSGSFLTAIPDTYLQNTDLSTEDGKVTAISGIPLSAGGDVPEGVMVESGLEYNAVNEISAYNGSAIAQYGAEKQWLQHDDTLVHAANSAQYALGVNISAVAQLLGVDETVLWSGNTGTDSPTTAFSINEPFSSFKRIRFEGMQYGNASPIYEITTPTANNNIGVLFSYFTLSENGNPYQIRGASYSSNNGTDYTEYKEKFLYWSNTSLTAVGGGTATNGPNIQRIIGIGRKEI